MSSSVAPGAPPPSQKSASRWGLWIQGLITVGIFAWLFHHTDWRALESRFAQLNLLWFLVALGMYVVNLGLSTLRWGIILRALERPASLGWLLRLIWVGAYFNQVLPGSVSGDVLRAWYTRPQTGSATLALAAVFGDRFIGMGSLVGIAVVAWCVGGQGAQWLPAMGETIAIMGLSYVVIVVLIVSPGLAFVEERVGKLGQKLQDIRTGIRILLCHPRALSATILLSVLVQLCSILMFWSLAHALGEQPEAIALWVVWPVVSLFLALPISLAGWGLREGLLVFYLGSLHMGHDAALALSLLLGATPLIASLPGALLWMGLHSRR